jgi:hypothetical protein
LILISGYNRIAGQAIVAATNRDSRRGSQKPKFAGKKEIPPFGGKLGGTAVQNPP